MAKKRATLSISVLSLILLLLSATALYAHHKTDDNIGGTGNYFSNPSLNDGSSVGNQTIGKTGDLGQHHTSDGYPPEYDYLDDYDPDYPEDCTYQDESDVWKIPNVSRGQKISIKLDIDPITGTIEYPHIDMIVFSPLVSDVEYEDPGFNGLGPYTEIDSYGYNDIDPVSGKMQKEIVFTANFTGTYYLQVHTFYTNIAEDELAKYKVTRNLLSNIPTITNRSTNDYLAEYPNTGEAADSYYKIYLKKGEKLIINMQITSSTSDLNANLTLYYISNENWVRIDDLTGIVYGNPQSLTYTAPSTKNYYVRIRAASGAGPYKLTTRRIIPGAINIKGGSKVTFGSKIKIYGTLNPPSKLADQTIIIKHKPYGASSWKDLAKVKTSEYGTYYYYAQPSKLTKYKVVWNGYTPSTEINQYSRCASSIKTINVSPKLSLGVSSTRIKVGEPVKLSGDIKPKHVGHQIILQKYDSNSKKWSKIASVKTNSYGKYLYNWKPPAGYHKTRAYFKGDSDHSWASSSYRSIRVE